jgi:hypothetical protein
MSFAPQGTLLAQLPTSSTAPLTQQDANLVNHIFGAADQGVDRKAVSSSLKSPLIVALLVGIMLHPMSDELVLKIYPKASENKYSMMAIKMALAAVAFFVLNHWALSRA